MIVIDASAMIEGLVGRAPDPSLMDVLGGDLSAPHLLDTEVMSVLRGLTLGGKIAPARAEQAKRHYFSFTIARQELEPLADRIWALRHRYTSYDASYVALAEAIDADLVTCDRKLDTQGHHARVRVVRQTAG